MLIAAACSTSDGPRRTLSDGEVRTILTGAVEHTGFLSRAEHELVAKCMARHGFRFVPTATEAAVEDPLAESTLTMADAEKRGYSLFRAGAAKARVGEAGAADPNGVIVKALSASERDRYTKTMFGQGMPISVEIAGATVSTAPDGCLSEVRRTLYGNVETWLRLDHTANNVMSEASQRVEGDAELIAVEGRWAECMSAAGLPFPTPRAARKAAADAHQGAASKAQALRGEIRIATADAKCRLQVGRDDVARAARARAAAIVVTEYEGDLLAAREMRATASERAQALLKDDS